MRIKVQVKEQWKQPVSGPDAWKAILFVVVLLAGILAFGQVIFQPRFERLAWAVLLLVLWIPAAGQLWKHGWRVLQNSSGLFLIGYTFFAVGNALPHGAAALWLTNIGAALLIAALAVTIFDFRKSRTSASTDATLPAS